MSILKDITELINANVISQETAEKIQTYYDERGKKSNSKILIIFGILGALLVGLGVILIIAHNWDDFSKTTKLFFSFLPLIVGQIVVGFFLQKKYNSTVWKESSSTFLFFAIGANISLIGQIYNLHSDLGLFIITWMLIFLPIIYLMNSSMGSLLYIVGITFYACETGYWSFPTTESINFWILILLIIPFYYLLYKINPQSNFFNWHNWFIPLSLTISLGIIANNFEEFLYLSYFSLFVTFQIIGDSNFIQKVNSKFNGYFFIGSIGSIVILLILSFDWFWSELQNEHFIISELLISPEFLASVFISLFAILLFLKQSKEKALTKFDLFPYSLVIFIIIFIIGIYSSFSAALVNLLTLAIGIYTIKQGINKNHLGVLNYGLLIITALIVCRFFDTDLTFIFRGVIFIIVGIGFFLANYFIIKKRKLNEE